MHVITKARLREKYEDHADLRVPALLWHTRMKHCDAENLMELRETFRTADSVGNFTIFNIKGNDYRLATFIDYEAQMVFIRAVMTHKEYDQNKWKSDDWFEG